MEGEVGLKNPSTYYLFRKLLPDSFRGNNDLSVSFIWLEYNIFLKFAAK